MVKRYPYLMEILISTPASYNENEGAWESSVQNWIQVGKCRFSVNGGGKISTEDSQEYMFNAVIYLPKGIYPFHLGDSVRVKNGDIIAISGTIKKFTTNQLHSIVWV